MPGYLVDTNLLLRAVDPGSPRYLAASQALAALLRGDRTAGRSRAMVRPLLRAIGHLPAIGRRGGPKVMRDVWRAVPPFAIIALLTVPLGFLVPDRRGPVAALAVAAGAMVGAWLLV